MCKPHSEQRTLEGFLGKSFDYFPRRAAGGRGSRSGPPAQAHVLLWQLPCLLRPHLSAQDWAVDGSGQSQSLSLGREPMAGALYNHFVRVPPQRGNCQDRRPTVTLTPGFMVMGAGSGLLTPTCPGASRLSGSTLEPHKYVLNK